MLRLECANRQWVPAHMPHLTRTFCGRVPVQGRGQAYNRVALWRLRLRFCQPVLHGPAASHVDLLGGNEIVWRHRQYGTI